jgi:hypothetical protein
MYRSGRNGRRVAGPQQSYQRQWNHGLGFKEALTWIKEARESEIRIARRHRVGRARYMSMFLGSPYSYRSAMCSPWPDNLRLSKWVRNPYPSLLGKVIRKPRLHVAVAAVQAILWLVVISTASHAETGSVAVVFTKGGLILGVGRGEGVLTFRGTHYPFTVSGISVGGTIGVSTTKLVGQAFNLRGPESIEGTYGAVGAGGALAGGAGSVRLRNTNGSVTNVVILQLSGPKVGVELSVAAAGVSIRLK